MKRRNRNKKRSEIMIKENKNGIIEGNKTIKSSIIMVIRRGRSRNRRRRRRRRRRRGRGRSGGWWGVADGLRLSGCGRLSSC